MVECWLGQVLDGNNAFMLALRHDDVTELNYRARTALRAEGALGPDELVVAGRAFAEGDWVMTLTNGYRLGVLNGQRGAITNIDPRRRTVTVAFDDNTNKTIPAQYLDAGGFDHAYALTVHKAQGQTCDVAYLLGGDELYREAGYSALSRGRHENHLYIAPPEPDDEAHVADEPENGFRTVVRALERSHHHDLALNWPEPHRREPPLRSREVDHGLDFGIDL